MSGKTAKIQDVARVAGVSTATVSRALSNPDMLTERTRKVVFDAVRETGYRVNRAARNLRTQKAGAVLVLVPNLGNPFFSQILSGISSVISDTDYSLLVADTADSPSRGKLLVDYFRDSRIDGLISLDGGLSASDLDLLAGQGGDNRIVFTCEWMLDGDYPSVRSDNARGAWLAMEHLHALGHREIAHITGPEGNVLTYARRDGMLAARREFGLPVREDFILRGDFTLKCGYDAAARIMALETRPTAVFCASDMVAFGLIAGLTAAGVKVPEEMSVVGFDDIEMSEYYVPALTTIRQDRQELGRRGASWLLKLLDDGELARDSVHTVDVSLVARNSTTRRT